VVRHCICAPAALVLALAGCAHQEPPTKAFIMQGAAVLDPQSVAVVPGVNGAVTAEVLVKGVRKSIAVAGAECNDGLGSIHIIDPDADGANSDVAAFDRGDQPQDQLFAALCEIRKRKLAERAPARN
jgi:hypothetical protein